jgi:hypothetical protein
MPSPVFGWADSEVTSGINTIVKIIKSLKSASSKYSSELAFLNGFKATFEHLENHLIKSNEQEQQSGDEGINKLTNDIARILKDIRKPWMEFQQFLEKYEDAFGEQATIKTTKSKLKQVPKMIQYTVEDLSGKVEQLRTRIEQPLQAVNSLLSLKIINSLDKARNTGLGPTQCALLIEAIHLANIPTELDKQIKTLSKAAQEQNLKQDQQLQVVNKLRTDLTNNIANLRGVLDEAHNSSSQGVTRAEEQHVEQMSAFGELQSSLDGLTKILEDRWSSLDTASIEQKNIIVALKQFLEHKILEEKVSNDSASIEQVSAGSNNTQSHWPPATLAVAYLTTTLLSSIASGMATASVIGRMNNPGARGSNVPVIATQRQTRITNARRERTANWIISGKTEVPEYESANPSHLRSFQQYRKPKAYEWVSQWISSQRAESGAAFASLGDIWVADFHRRRAGGGGGDDSPFESGERLSKLSFEEHENDTDATDASESSNADWVVLLPEGFPETANPGEPEEDVGVDDSDGSSRGGGFFGAFFGEDQDHAGHSDGHSDGGSSGDSGGS